MHGRIARGRAADTRADERGCAVAVTIGQEQIGGLTVTRQEDGRYALDFTAAGGPFIVLTATSWAALCRLVRRAREDLTESGLSAHELSAVDMQSLPRAGRYRRRLARECSALPALREVHARRHTPQAPITALVSTKEGSCQDARMRTRAGRARGRRRAGIACACATAAPARSTSHCQLAARYRGACMLRAYPGSLVAG